MVVGSGQTLPTGVYIQHFAIIPFTLRSPDSKMSMSVSSNRVKSRNEYFLMAHTQVLDFLDLEAVLSREEEEEEEEEETLSKSYEIVHSAIRI